ncbi:MAG: hypothetical protein P9M06_03215 [Candidatus Saelkia tenebricola]|nr:hypothetical protein [Candidatus Saelkia tenebricola]
MKKILVIIGIILISGVCEAAEIENGMNQYEVLRILGKPDLITTREQLQDLIYPRVLDSKRYQHKFEFWIYYKYPNQREIWGYVEFDKEEVVVEASIHRGGERTDYKVEGKTPPDMELFKDIGAYTGEDWNFMPDKSRLLLIVEVIDKLRSKNVFVRKNLFYYLEEIDSFYQDQAHVHFTVINTLYCFAVLNKDWDDGSDVDERIRKMLPTDMWSEFTE